MNKIYVISFLVVAIAVFVYFTGTNFVSTNQIYFQGQVMPGKLSAAHAQLSTNCASCHTASKGADDAKCISCHSSNTALLQRQPTAFHAIIANCASCHTEHQGVEANLKVMNPRSLSQNRYHHDKQWKEQFNCYQQPVYAR